MADYGIEKYMKWAVGKAEVEDALQRLDLLTKEENLTMMMAINLEDTHHFDDDDDDATIIEETFQDVHDDVRATQEVFRDLGSTKLDVIDRDLRSINDHIKVTKPSMPILSISSCTY